MTADEVNNAYSGNFYNKNENIKDSKISKEEETIIKTNAVKLQKCYEDIIKGLTKLERIKLDRELTNEELHFEKLLLNRYRMFGINGEQFIIKSKNSPYGTFAIDDYINYFVKRANTKNINTAQLFTQQDSDNLRNEKPINRDHNMYTKEDFVKSTLTGAANYEKELNRILHSFDKHKRVLKDIGIADKPPMHTQNTNVVQNISAYQDEAMLQMENEYLTARMEKGRQLDIFYNPPVEVKKKRGRKPKREIEESNWGKSQSLQYQSRNLSLLENETTMDTSMREKVPKKYSNEFIEQDFCLNPPTIKYSIRKSPRSGFRESVSNFLTKNNLTNFNEGTACAFLDSILYRVINTSCILSSSKKSPQIDIDDIKFVFKIINKNRREFK